MKQLRILFLAAALFTLAASPAPANVSADLITMCHVPPNPDVTIQVSIFAVLPHLFHGDYFGPCVVVQDDPTPTPTDIPPDPTATDVPPDPTDIPPDETEVPPDATEIPVLPEVTDKPAKIVVPKMWLLIEDNGSWCILISETHPGAEVQGPKCFGEGSTWVADNAPCAGPVYNNDFWKCDKYGYPRLSVEELEDRYGPFDD